MTGGPVGGRNLSFFTPISHSKMTLEVGGRVCLSDYKIFHTSCSLGFCFIFPSLNAPSQIWMEIFNPTPSPTHRKVEPRAEEGEKSDSTSRSNNAGIVCYTSLWKIAAVDGCVKCFDFVLRFFFFFLRSFVVCTNEWTCFLSERRWDLVDRDEKIAG